MEGLLFAILMTILLFLHEGSGQIVPDTFIILQDQFGGCHGIENPQNRTLKDRNVFTVLSQAKEQTFYESNRNCVVSLLGKVGWQWSITITFFDIDGEMDAGGKPIRCRDFVKLYDAERCDNAKLLKGINYKTGLCGTLSESQIGQLVFTTCANKLTIQFKTDNTASSSRGFSMELSQYPWTNPYGAPDCDPDLNGILAGVWRDGTFTEFQNFWNEQPVVPGYVAGGRDTDYNKELGGITCYECTNCPVEPFRPEYDGTAVDTNCYVCSKEWDEEYQMARRKCYSQTDYLNLLDSIREFEDPFIGCRQTTSQWGRSVNYCFCDTDKCNKSSLVICSVHLLLVTVCVALTAIKYFS